MAEALADDDNVTKCMVCKQILGEPRYLKCLLIDLCEYAHSVHSNSLHLAQNNFGIVIFPLSLHGSHWMSTWSFKRSRIKVFSGSESIHCSTLASVILIFSSQIGHLTYDSDPSFLTWKQDMHFLQNECKHLRYLGSPNDPKIILC
jgi:hypothetical protein